MNATIKPRQDTPNAAWTPKVSERLQEQVNALMADNAALRERIKVLEEAVQHYESALRDAWPEGAKGASWEFWNRARIVLSALEKT